VAVSDTGTPGAPSGTESSGAPTPPTPSAPPTEDFLAGLLRPVTGFLREFWLPLLPALILTAAAVWVWRGTAEHEFDAVREASRAQAGWARGDVEKEIQSRVRALDRLASATPSLDPFQWNQAAGGMVAAGTFRAIELLDVEGRIRAVAPEGARLMASLQPDDDDVRTLVLHAAMVDVPMNGGARVAGTVQLESGERQLVIVAPLDHSNVREGSLIGVLRIRDVLDPGLRLTLRRGYTVSVSEGTVVIHGPQWETRYKGAEYAYDVDLSADRMLWTLRVWPDEEAARRLGSMAPRAALAFGLLAALFAALFTWTLTRRPAFRTSRTSATPS
jgi:sensor domain CHASE-containing protein